MMQKRAQRLGLVMVMGLLMGACGSSTSPSGADGGGGGGGGGCNVAASCTSSGGATCLEFAVHSSAAQQACGNGTYTQSGCSHTNAVGGCRQGSGSSCTTTWYYSTGGLSAAQVMGICSASGQTFVNP